MPKPKKGARSPEPAPSKAAPSAARSAKTPTPRSSRTAGTKKTEAAPTAAAPSRAVRKASTVPSKPAKKAAPAPSPAPSASSAPAKATKAAPARKPAQPAAKAASKAASRVDQAAGDGSRPAKPADKWLVEQQELLLRERARLIHQADSLKAEADQLAEEMEPGDIQFDEESGEGATTAVERERDLALSAQARAEVEEIDRALAKIADGTYGVCTKCGQPIPKPRLKAVPQATLCVPCKSGGLLRR